MECCLLWKLAVIHTHRIGQDKTVRKFNSRQSLMGNMGGVGTEDFSLDLLRRCGSVDDP